MINTAVTVQEVCVVNGYIARESYEAEDKGQRSKSQAAANRSPSRRQVLLRELCQNPLQEGTGITTGTIAM